MGPGATLIAPQFVLEAWHQGYGNVTVGGQSAHLAEDPSTQQNLFARVFGASGGSASDDGASDLAIGLLPAPINGTTPAEVLPSDWADYIQPNGSPAYAVSVSQDNELALSDWVGTVSDPITGSPNYNSGENEMLFNALSTTDPLAPWGIEPARNAAETVPGDSGGGVFLLFNGQTVVLGGQHWTGGTLSGSSDVSDNISAINQVMAQLWSQGQSLGIIPSNLPAEQLTQVNLSGFSKAPTLQLKGGNVNVNVNQSVPLVVTASKVTVPDGESVILEDASHQDAVVATGTFTGNTAALTVPAGTLVDGTHSLFAAYGGDATLGSSFSTPETVNVALQLTSTAINANIAGLVGSQQSEVDSVVYTFSEPVTCGTGAFSIALDTNAEVNGTPNEVGIVPTLNWAAVNPDANGYSSQWAVTFSGNGVINQSIADGVYDLTLAPYAAADAANFVMYSPTVFTFVRLFGDINGNDLVNNADYGLFTRAFQSSVGQAAYVAGFDYDGNGVINNYDYGQFTRRFQESFTP